VSEHSPVTTARPTPVERVLLPHSLRRLLRSTTEHEDLVASLLDAEHSRRILLVRAIIELTDSLTDSAEVKPSDIESLREAWSLLEAVDARDSSAIRRVLLAPSTGLWAARLVRRLRNGPAATDPVPLWVEIGHLSQIAAAAALTAGVDFSITVPVRGSHGVFLPGLGTALIDIGEPWGTATVRSQHGSARVEAAESVVDVPKAGDGPGWLAVRRLHARHPQTPLTVDIDDMGPYTLGPDRSPADRLSDEDVARWQGWLEAAWSLLVLDHGESARALARGVLSLAPLPRGDRLRARSASSSDAFGSVLLSEPDQDPEVLPAQFASTLVHEFRHTLLNGYLALIPLFGDDPELYRAPWRDDPRPVGGIVHGAFAFSGVARFWKTRAALDTGKAGELARFEYALWRRETRQVLDTLDSCQSLTGEGRALAAALAAEIEPWSAQPDAAQDVEAREAAALASDYHRVSWRAHHRRPDPDAVKRLAEAWQSRLSSASPTWSDRLDTAARSVVIADPDACRLDVLALLIRLKIIAPEEFAALSRDPAGIGSRVPGATDAELALLGGDLDLAAKLCLEQLDTDPARPAALAGLALAIAGRDKQAATALASRPELIRAVREAVTITTPSAGHRPDPLELARWLTVQPSQGHGVDIAV
jgi:HEXXH motif-containing protein